MYIHYQRFLFRIQNWSLKLPFLRPNPNNLEILTNFKNNHIQIKSKFISLILIYLLCSTTGCFILFRVL
jgi:hypothetical protein